MLCYYVAIIQVNIMTDRIIINLENVSFKYDRSEPIINGLDLKILQGEKVGILGANGAGKSTILKLITGLLYTNEGLITVFDKEVNAKNIKEIRDNLGYTFQDPDNQLFMPSVYEDIAFSLRQQKVEDSLIHEKVDDVLKEVGGSHLKDKASYKMSGGEKRIVTLATALINKPELLILDEPSVGLDPKSRRQLINLLMNRRETMIITTHDMDMALDLCDRVLVLNEGVVQGDDKPSVIFNNKKLVCNNNLELPLRMQGCPVCSQK